MSEEHPCTNGCQFSGELSRRISNIETALAVLSTKTQDFGERMDRHGRAVDRLAVMYSEKIDDFNGQLNGHSGKPGVIAIADECMSRIKAQEASRNGWMDWTFRVVIMLMVGWVVANTTVLLRSDHDDRSRYQASAHTDKQTTYFYEDDKHSTGGNTGN